MDLRDILLDSVRLASGQGTFLGGMRGSASALYLASREEPLLAVAPGEHEAELLGNDIRFYQQLFCPRTVEVLPSPDDARRAGEHARIIHSLPKVDTVVSSPDAVLGAVSPPTDGDRQELIIRRGDTVEREAFIDVLRSFGYREAAVVSQQGEFCHRHFIIDVFPSTERYPVRFEFFGDELESLRTFRIDTQRSERQVDKCVLYPARKMREEGGVPFLDLCSGERDVYEIENALVSRMDDVRRTTLSFVSASGDDGPFHSFSGTGVLASERRSFEDITDVLSKRKERVIIVLRHQYQAKRISELFSRNGIHVPVLDLAEARVVSEQIAVTIGSLSEGLLTDGIMILTPKELFGREMVISREFSEEGKRFINNYEDIQEGDFVVHAEHGVGRFRGLSRHVTDGYAVEVVLVEYAESSLLYVPLYHINRLHKFRAEEGFVPSLDRIGGKTWNRKKRKAKRKIDIMVGHLMELYAQREAVQGIPASSDTEVHREFYSFFPYQETEDQRKAVEEISDDMESNVPMDRVLCGDVGFGKTEVAMRAAFKAVYDNRQVAVVVPTTILCEQHFRNFKERFAAFPVVIDFLSRFKTPAQSRSTIERVGKGEVDILIGTSSLFRKDLVFSDLGLLIIDEEHRFGVAQKEKIKELRHGVDSLMMSATPIPRTLQMALSGIRSMSVIETPPEERLAVHSVIARFDNNLIASAVSKEVIRGGQVFFVAPRIRDLEYVRERLIKFLPDVRIVMAHGRMNARELENIMIGFMDHDSDLLLSTNIIASGIDIPSANTLIVHRADQFGLADLYQLKGRVGRGSVRGHAYFLVNASEAMTEQGAKRLRAIEELSYLGAGLKLAMKDLEIRGAGTLFGYEQSGHIHEIGFDMYMDMIKMEVERIKGEGITEEPDAEVSVPVDALIPDDYVSDETVRLSLYRRLAGADSEEELSGLGDEMRDRFGALPESTERLLTIVGLRIIARQCKVHKVEVGPSRATVSFRNDSGIKLERMFRLAELYGGLRYREDGFDIPVDKGGPMATIILVRNIFLSIQKHH